MPTNNDASQTLFRMVSLRNPQLTEIKTRNFGFIQRPKGAIGIFDEAVNTSTTPTTRMDILLKAAPNTNTNGFETEAEIEAGIYGKLLIIGRKISKKETLNEEDWKYTKEYYAKLIDLKNKELSKAGIAELTILWDNLIYQVVTQKDFYVKEAISHILKAIHLGFAQNTEIDEDIIKTNGEKPLGNALDAKIVLPKHLFIEDSSEVISAGERTNSLTPLTIQRLTNEAKTDLVVHEALYNKESLIKLNVELKQLEKSFYKQRNKAYDEAYGAYKKKFQPKIDEYEKKRKELESQVEEKDEKDQNALLRDKLPEIDIPSFEFAYKKEINIKDLKDKLSPESFSRFLSLFSSKVQNKVPKVNSKDKKVALSETQIQYKGQVFEINDTIENYNIAVDEIDNQIATEIQTTLQNTPFVQEQYINIGGASVPVAQNSSRTPLAYSLTANSIKYDWFGLFTPGFVMFSFEVENSTWNVVNAKVIADTNSGHFEENYSNLSVIDNKVTLPICLVNKFLSINSFRVEIFFGNGKEAFLEITKIPNDEILTGMLTLKNLLPVDASNRKNFGIKRIGVADYLKVVQSVHAYVPGLVSNIENVMASELRHKSSVSREYSEITDTTSKSQETEKISDTSKTSRSDMQSEVAKELSRQQAISAHTRFNYDSGPYKFEIGAEYANNTAQQDSTRQAVMKSQEITERAMERVLTKVSEERVQKIIKEYTETNVHEFDNRGKVIVTNNADAAQPKHITGVYRWIDIKYKNQIYNYGIRTMFEFMIPEPARLHRLALSVAKGQILTPPTDPRKADGVWKMPNALTASKELLQHWADIYKVELEASLPNTKQVVHVTSGFPSANRSSFGPDYSQFVIPEDYIGKNASFNCRSNIENSDDFWNSGFNSDMKISNLRGGIFERGNDGSGNSVGFYESSYGLLLNGNVNYYVSGYNIGNYTVEVTVNCELSEEYTNKWKTENFNAIIKAYDVAYKTFQDEQAKLDEEQKKKEEAQKEKLGQFYRYMEQDVLKHNCIAYLLQDYLSPKTIGQSYTLGDKMQDFAVTLGGDLDKYTALAKLIEQAFEWEIMDYTFYPYYWANRQKWQEMYMSESMDPLFRSFLQAGMARVIATVRPGFENAVQLFIETGLIWNGGEVPVIGDPMYMSIVDEMRKPLGTPQGKYWISKLPTTLTILQDKSTGLAVDQALPIFPESDPSQCENPSELVNEPIFVSRDISLGIVIGQPSTLPKD
jgi:hypothetical protein